MKILVTGGTGFIGIHLCEALLSAGHEVTAVGTRASFPLQSRSGCRYLRADSAEPGSWQEAAAGQDAVVNLAGRSIFKRWTEKYKKQIYGSRILSTRHLVEALPAGCTATLLSASAVGYYGDCGERELTEASVNGSDFLALLARDWEAEALGAAAKGCRVVVMRFGIVLGRGGGALASMLPAFKSYLGGPLGSGRQWFPWIHIEDLVRAQLFFLERAELSGIFNLCSPKPVRNAELTQDLAQLLGRPAVVRVPRLALKMAAGELTSALLASQKAVPARLLESGFEFSHPDIRSALTGLLH